MWILLSNLPKQGNSLKRSLEYAESAHSCKEVGKVPNIDVDGLTSQPSELKLPSQCKV